MDAIRLTQYSHGAGCGCKLSPAVLDSILKQVGVQQHHPDLLVGNDSKDDAAVFDLGDGTAVVSTTDFFMPIVDDPVDFGKIAATNAISDIYAMGGTPMMAIAILGWPIDKLDAKVAGLVLEGGRQSCAAAGIPLAGGHSIDSPEPIFGLAVTGRVSIDGLKRNDGAQQGDVLFLTKGIGVGMITTAQKKQLAADEHVRKAVQSMQQLNNIGQALSKVKGVHAMTDVTGFGLLGHLTEVCQSARLTAEIYAAKVPRLIDDAVLRDYHARGAVPGGTKRNFASYGDGISVEEGYLRDLLCDPQTSGGLLLSVSPGAIEEVRETGRNYGIDLEPIGKMLASSSELIVVQ
jgi:selenide,water dikinase